MEEDGVEQKLNDKNLVTFVEKGPKFVDTLGNLQERTNLIKSTDDQRSERTFTEGQGLGDLLYFVDTTIEIAAKNGDKETEETAKLFKENLVFVGEKELKEATQGIARHLLEEAQKGKDILFYWENLRSERYITLRVLEEIDYLTEESPELRSRFKLSNGPREIAKECKDRLGNCLVSIPDDFIVSGSRTRMFASHVMKSLIDEGFSSDKASEMIEANVVASKRRGEEQQVVFGDEERCIRIFSFYEIGEYKNNEGIWAVFPGASFTGSHSSTDYGFEQVLEGFSTYLKSKNIFVGEPLLTKIVRPYLADHRTYKYKDPELQARWEKIQEKYGLRAKTEKL